MAPKEHPAERAQGGKRSTAVPTNGPRRISQETTELMGETSHVSSTDRRCRLGSHSRVVVVEQGGEVDVGFGERAVAEAGGHEHAEFGIGVGNEAKERLDQTSIRQLCGDLRNETERAAVDRAAIHSLQQPQNGWNAVGAAQHERVLGSRSNRRALVIECLEQLSRVRPDPRSAETFDRPGSHQRMPVGDEPSPRWCIARQQHQ